MVSIWRACQGDVRRGYDVATCARAGAHARSLAGAIARDTPAARVHKGNELSMCVGHSIRPIIRSIGRNNNFRRRRETEMRDVVGTRIGRVDVGGRGEER